LQEIKAQIIPCRNAKSAAEAFEAGKRQSTEPWIVYSHQDVYFPEGSGREIEKALETEEQDRILGFIGLSGTPNSDVSLAGWVVDRVTNVMDYPASSSAITVDELAVILHRDCKYRIDPRFGWHRWATDLCLQAAFDGNYAKILRVLLHHNSKHDNNWPPEVYASAEALLDKYPQLSVIHTLCGSLTRAQKAVESPRTLRRWRLR
jgi:hypothetical protein